MKLPLKPMRLAVTDPRFSRSDPDPIGTGRDSEDALLYRSAEPFGGELKAQLLAASPNRYRNKAVKLDINPP